MSSSISTKMIQATACYIELPVQDDVSDVVVGLARMAYASVFRAPFAIFGACTHLAGFGKSTIVYLVNRNIREWNRAKNELTFLVEEISHFIFSCISYFLAAEIISFSLAPIPFVTCLVVLGACQWSNLQAITDKVRMNEYRMQGVGIFQV